MTLLEMLKALARKKISIPAGWIALGALIVVIAALQFPFMVGVYFDRNEWRDIALKFKTRNDMLFRDASQAKKENAVLRIYQRHYEAVSKQCERLEKENPRANEVLIDALYRVADRYNLQPDSLIALSKGKLFYTTQWFTMNNAPFQY